MLVPLLIACSLAVAQAPGRKAIVHVRALTQDPVLGSIEDATVVLEDDRIAAVGRAGEVEIPAGAAVIDGLGRTLIPGLIDGHVHLGGAGAPKNFATRDAAYAADARAALIAGVTTVVDLNADDAIFALRDAERSRRDRNLPRIVCAGARLSEGGAAGGDERPGLARRADETAAALVERALALQPDLVKIAFDSGGWAGQPERPAFDAATLGALIGAAHERGKLVAVHAVDAARVRVALEQGADWIAHLPFVGALDAETTGLWVEKGAALTPTLTALCAPFRSADDPQWFGDALARELIDPALLAEVRGDSGAESPERTFFRARWPAIAAELKALAAAGVPIVAGSDAGQPLCFHGLALHQELSLMVECGLRNDQALAAATREAAKRLPVDPALQLGVIRPGAVADLVLLDGNPLERIGDTRRIARVFKGGDEVPRDFLLAQWKEQRPTLPFLERRVLFRLIQGDALPVQPALQTIEETTTCTLAVGEDPESAWLHLSVVAAAASKPDSRGGVVIPVEGGAALAPFRSIRVRLRADAETAVRLAVRTRGVFDLDYHGSNLLVRPEWRWFEIPFDALAQVGFGRRVRFDPAEIEAIEIATERGMTGSAGIDVGPVLAAR